MSLRVPKGVVVFLAGLAWSACATARQVTVFAAASLTDAMNAVIRAYAARQPAVGIRTSYASSGMLARQIDGGAPADIFFSADESWMDYLEKRSRIEPGSRVSRLGNRLVLIAPAGPARRVEINKGVDLLALLGPGGRLVTGDPASVPVGRYAQQALAWLGAWPALQFRIARADNVRVAMSYVERGEAPLGIVYSTDAAIARGVQVIGEFPEESHPAISYPLAIVAGRATPPVREFHVFLRGSGAGEVFRKFGFSVK